MKISSNQIHITKKYGNVSILLEAIFHEGLLFTDLSISVLPKEFPLCSVLTSLWIMPVVRTCEQGWGDGGGGWESCTWSDGDWRRWKMDRQAEWCQVTTLVMLLLRVATVTVKPVWKLRTLPWRHVGRGQTSLKRELSGEGDASLWQSNYFRYG